MSNSPDPSLHKQREEQVIQHVEKLLTDDRLRIQTIDGRKPITLFRREVARADRALEMKKTLIEAGSSDRELQSRMPTGQSIEVWLSRSHLWFFTKVVGRLRVVCLSPTRDLAAAKPGGPIGAAEVTKALEALVSAKASSPGTTIVASTSGFDASALALVECVKGKSTILIEPNAAGGWKAHAAPEDADLAALFNPESDQGKRQRVRELIAENQVDLLTAGISSDKLAEQAQLPLELVESALKEYAKSSPGLAAKRLDGRLVLYREGSSALAGATASNPGVAMGLMDKITTLLGHKADNEKKIAFLAERKAALGQQLDRAYGDMQTLETQEAALKEQFKTGAGAITKRRVTGQMLQLRKDLERRQQLVQILGQQINIVSTHLHNLELVRQGKSAKLPDAEEITADAVAAEEVLAQLEADGELAGSVGQIGTVGMSDEEKALYEELEAESGGAEKKKQADGSTSPSEPLKATAGKSERQASKPAESRDSASAAPNKSPASPQSAPPRRLDPEAG